MDQAIQGDNSGASSVMPVKRGRGRPRKDQNPKQVKTACGPSGLGLTGKRAHKADRVGGNDNMVGQAVTGVVEASFDAGYVLTLKVGNSNAVLRGVVFKPGHYVPVTAENDVAPNIQMIRRNEVPFQAGKRTRPRAQKPAIQTPGTAGKYGSPNVVSSSAVPPVDARATVVPVVFHPAYPSNGPPTSNQMPSDASEAAA